MSTTTNPDEVILGGSGGPGLWIAPSGTALPTDATTAPGLGFRAVGYVSDDGATIGNEVETEDITPWQSSSPIRTVITGRVFTLGFAMWEASGANMALYLSAETPAEGDSFAITIRGDDAPKTWAVILDVQDGDTVLRFAFPRATLSEAGEAEIKRGSPAAWPVTLKALDSGDGIIGYVYRGTASTAPAGALVAAQ